MSALVFMGPFAPFQAPSIGVPGADIYSVGCTGDGFQGSPKCPDVAELYTDADGRKVPGMLRKLRADPASEVFVQAFSAGGSVAKRLTLDPNDRAQITAMVLSDASYGDGSPIEGYVRYALDALSGNKMMVATSSAWPNKTFPNGAQVLEATKDEIERRSGQKFTLSTSWPGIDPQPVQLWTLGGVMLADYQFLVPHGGHGTVLAPQIWQQIVNPWLAGASPNLPPPVPQPKNALSPEKPVSNTTKVMALGTGVLIGYLGTRWLVG